MEEEKQLEEIKKEREAEEEQEFNCKICFEVFEEENEIMPLQLCEHIFHQECMIQYLKSKIEDSKFPIFCPDP